MKYTSGLDFLDNTKFHHLKMSGQMRGMQSPPLELPIDPTKKVISLPDPREATNSILSIRVAVERRRSIRNYTKEPLSLVELSYLLWATQGVQKIYQNSVTLRTVPSAGARHALETYLLINNVKTLKPGVYRFLSLEHKLQEYMISPDISDKIVSACLGQTFIKASAVTFLWAAIPKRMTWRYSDRGYRYLFLDVGHVCQNLYLCGESIQCGTCAIAAFLDDDLNNLLGFDGETQFVIYLATVGKKE
jgi:SagB-type dehydrogenase family enzyme